MMRKSTRVLSLLLVLVMVFALMPTFTLEAKADGKGINGETVYGDETRNKSILQFAKSRTISGKRVIPSIDRTVIKSSDLDTADWGYNDSTYWLIRKDSGIADFTIRRDQDGTGLTEDGNRWWRWDTWVNKNTEWADSGAGGFYAHIDGTKDDDHLGIIKSDDTKNCWIKVKNGDYYKWTGGGVNRANYAVVKIDSSYPIGTRATLLSANGTRYLSEVAQSWVVTAVVQPGDISSHIIAIVGEKDVVYDLNGGYYNNNDTKDYNDQRYVCWSADDKTLSQQHVMKGAPTRDGYRFLYWKCVENDKSDAGKTTATGVTFQRQAIKNFAPDNGDLFDYVVTNQGTDVVVGGQYSPDTVLTVMSNVKFEAVWEYDVNFHGNGETSGTMDTQTIPEDVETALNENQFEQVFTVNYNVNNASATVSPDSDVAASTFDGWGNTATSGVKYDDKEVVTNLPDREGHVNPVNLYAQWIPGSVTLPTPTAPDGYEFKGWYTADGKKIEGTSFVPADYATPANPVVNLHAEWKLTFNIAHVQAGEVVSTETAECTPDYNIVNKTTANYLYGGTFTDAACENEPVTSPESFTPEVGKTYYIWEVTREHLQPLTLCVYERVDACNYNVTNVFLLTAVDRVNYKEAGFYVDGEKTVVKDSTGNVAYDEIGLKLPNNIEVGMSYNSINPKATTTKNSKIVCYEVDGFNDKKTRTMQPYWVTLDGVEVKGTNTRSFTYNGVGPDQANKQLTVIDSEAIYYQPTPGKSFYKAPLMLMSRYSMGQETNPVNLNDIPEVPDEPDVPDVPDEPDVPEVPDEPDVPDVPDEPDVPEVPDEPDVPEVKAMLNVVDGENAYEVEISDDMALTAAGVDGQLFGGWFADKGCTIPADLSKATDGDTVYAKYISDSYLQIKYNAVFTLLSKSVSLTSAVDSKDYAETGYVISTKNGDKSVVVTDYASRFALQNAKQLFGVEKNAPLMNVDYKLSGLSKNDKITITPYLVTADGTTVYGTARTLTYTGLTVRG